MKVEFNGIPNSPIYIVDTPVAPLGLSSLIPQLILYKLVVLKELVEKDILAVPEGRQVYRNTVIQPSLAPAGQ